MVGFPDQRERIDAERGMGAALMYVGEYGQAIGHLDEAEALARKLQAPDQIANAVGIKTQCFYRMDRWDDVLAIEAKWRELDARYSRERVGETCFFSSLTATVQAWRGDRPAAVRNRREAVDYMVSMSGQSDEWQRNQFY